MSTNLPRFALSAKAQEWMDLAPELVAQFKEVTPVDHTPPETFEGLTWFVVVCNPKCERRAQLGLRRKGYQTYVPMMLVDVKHARKIETVERVLLPRYLFIGLKPGQDFWGMRSVDGVEGIVRNNNAPVSLKPDRLKMLRDRESSGAFDYSGAEKRRKAEMVAKCKPGSHVEIKKAGALAGLLAVVEQVHASGQITLLLDFLGRATPVKIGIGEVELLEAAE